LIDRSAKGGVYAGIVVAKNVRRESGVIVDVFVAIRVPDAAALAADEDDKRLDFAVDGHHAARDGAEAALGDGF
jgi:hypothetical protein